MGLRQWYTYYHELLLPLSNKLVIALVLVLLGLIFGRIGARVIQKFLEEMHVNETANKALGIKINLEELTALGVRYAVYLIFIILALDQLGVTTIIIQVIASGFLVMVLVSLFLAVRDFIPNFMAGLKLQKEDFLKEGDQVTVGDLKGRVQKIQLTDTLIKTKESDFISVPNAYLLKHPLKRKKRK